MVDPAQARVEFALEYEHAGIVYRDRRVANDIRPGSDRLPSDLGRRLRHSEPGLTFTLPVADVDRLASHDPAWVRSFPRGHFNRRFGRTIIEPVAGRYYPRTLIAAGINGLVGDRTPFRLLDFDATSCRVDLNHPLSGYDLDFSATLLESTPARPQGREHCQLAVALAAAGGPGMQVPLQRSGWSAIPPQPLQRGDTREDALFYQQPRLVQHIDSVAVAEVCAVHGRLLESGMRVLDLMSSWTTHVPASLSGLQLSGLGMNAGELDVNPRLADWRVHDLNRVPQLPWRDGYFDAVICAMSVEYLIRPLEVFREVARVLRPGGLFINTFSERWFPTKVVDVWTRLHPFERMGLVIDYYRQAGGYGELHAESVRGHLRPRNDPYAGRMKFSDPVYAVWGRRV